MTYELQTRTNYECEVERGTSLFVFVIRHIRNS